MRPPPRLDQGANIGDIHNQRSGASTARDQIGTLRAIRSECLRAMVGIRTRETSICFLYRAAASNIASYGKAFPVRSVDCQKHGRLRSRCKSPHDGFFAERSFQCAKRTRQFADGSAPSRAMGHLSPGRDAWPRFAVAAPETGSLRSGALVRSMRPLSGKRQRATALRHHEELNRGAGRMMTSAAIEASAICSFWCDRIVKRLSVPEERRNPGDGACPVAASCHVAPCSAASPHRVC